MSLELTPQTASALDTLLENGWYTSAEQIVEIAVTNLLEDEPHNAHLRKLVQEGIDALQNEPVITREEFLLELEERRRKRA